MDKLEELKTKHQEVEKILKGTLKELTDIKFALDTSTIVAITDQKGKITYVNDKFCEVSQYSREELLGQDHRIVNSGYHPKEYIRNLWKAIARGEVWRGEFRNRAKDGSIYWVDTTIVPFLNEKGKPYQYVAIRHLITEKKEMEESIKALSQRILQAQEEERERIARDIHDDLGQSLATLKLLFQSTSAESLNSKVVLKKSFAKMVEDINTIIEKTRNIATVLRPPTLEVLGLTTAIKVMIEEFKRNTDMRIEMTALELDHFLFLGAEINLYRIIQEAMTNIVKHAKATRVDIGMSIKENILFLTIQDNGKGFIGYKVSETSGLSETTGLIEGLGLSTMRERTKLLGGELHIHSQKGRGTAITLSIPLYKEKKKK